MRVAIAAQRGAPMIRHWRTPWFAAGLLLVLGSTAFVGCLCIVQARADRPLLELLPVYLCAAPFAFIGVGLVVRSLRRADNAEPHAPEWTERR